MEKQVIEDFSQKQDKTNAQNFYSASLNTIQSALDDLINIESGFVTLDENSTKVFPMGDYTNDTFIDENGELEVVIASSNPQIIYANQIFINNIKNAKSKKQLKTINNDGTFDKIIVDFAGALAEYYDNSTVILLVNDGIKVFCNSEYNFKLLIRFATYSENDPSAILTFWNPIQKNSHASDLFLYNENMEKKDEDTHGNYKKLVRIYKNIRKNILMNKMASNSSINKYFIELIIFNVPNELITDNDIYAAFVKSVNYLTNCDVSQFTSFDGSKIESFSLANISHMNIRNFINLISKILL